MAITHVQAATIENQSSPIVLAFGDVMTLLDAERTAAAPMPNTRKTVH